MANQSVSWKGCDIPINPAQVGCDFSITTRFAIFDVAKYHFWCSRYFRKRVKFEFWLRETRFAIIGGSKCQFWCYQVPQTSWSSNRERACGKKWTQRQLYVFMALLRVSRLRVSADPQVLSTWGSAETLSRETRSSAAWKRKVVSVLTQLYLSRGYWAPFFCWETPQFFNSYMWQEVAMAEPKFSLDWIWNLLKNVCKSWS